jgi:secreted PhoX family phosphatase
MVAQSETSPLGPLRPDPDALIDLPNGFSYRIVSRAGDPMDDGLMVPQSHDGMAAFAGNDDRIILVCNHELGLNEMKLGAFGADIDSIPASVQQKFYDAGSGVSPLMGGTTTTIYNPATGRTERQHLSLVGTEWNCSGGSTPWDSWLSCEETFRIPGRIGEEHRDKAHGYVFEVPARETGLVEPVPIKAMGRFEHEAAAVHTASGIVYLTEDQRSSLFYRYIPDQPGRLLAGGRLQALAIGHGPSVRTDNWSTKSIIRPDEEFPVRWIDLDNVDSDTNDLRKRGAALGATTFMRCEGMCVVGDEIFFTATVGGPSLLGQVFRYRTGQGEGKDTESAAPGTLTLIAESTENSLLRGADNITMAPFGDLIVCEDTASNCGIVGIGPDGAQYAIADNPHSDSELAGACFSPDGEILFVNIQYPGITLAITGPWPVG